MNLETLPTRPKQGGVHVVVETPRNARVKLKWEPALGVFGLSRPLARGLSWPYDWGFVPSTRAEDGDPLDALVLWDVPSYPGVVLPCRVVGALGVEQKGEKGRVRNDRLMAVPHAARREASLTSVLQLSERERQELASFFLAAVALEGKEAKVLGWMGPEEAEALVARSMVHPP